MTYVASCSNLNFPVSQGNHMGMHYPSSLCTYTHAMGTSGAEVSPSLCPCTGHFWHYGIFRKAFRKFSTRLH